MVGLHVEYVIPVHLLNLHGKREGLLLNTIGGLYEAAVNEKQMFSYQWKCNHSP